MPYANPYPPVRISPEAKIHLGKIVDALKAVGLRVSEASHLTSLILAQPIPNGHTPVRDDSSSAAGIVQEEE